MADTLATWLRQQREARGWTRREMARQLIEAGHDAGDTTVPGMDSMCHNIHRWERGRGGLTERYKIHYCRAFGIHPSQFGLSTGEAAQAAAPEAQAPSAEYVPDALAPVQLPAAATAGFAGATFIASLP